MNRNSNPSKEVALEINVEKIKYMLLSRYLNACQNQDRLFQNISQFKYLRTTVTNQNFIQEEIKRRPNSGNSCYHSVQNLLSSPMLSKTLKIRICLVSDIKRGTYIGGVWEQGAGEDIWTEEGWNTRRVEKIAQWGASLFVLFAKYN
jgi:hypothetical protein